MSRPEGSEEFSTVPVMGLMGKPEAVVDGAPELAPAGGALTTPLWKRKPATLPYPT